MVSSVVKAEVLRALERLAEPKQRLVLDFVRSLSDGQPPTIAGQELLRLAGTLDPESARAMTDAVAEGCERVDHDRWK